MAELDFIKYQGAGNDFVLVDARAPGTPLIDAAVARRLCDRHYGIGADGILVMLPSEVADCRMHVINADGSVPEMCGNGLRCAARWAFEVAQLTASPTTLRLETGRGVLDGEIEVNAESRRFRSVRFDMGGPLLDRAEVPMRGEPGRHVDAPVGDVVLTAVSMGNPHAVVWVDEVSGEVATQLAEQIAAAQCFPNGVNTEAAALREDGGVDVVVHERGVGLTLACGTGACAVVVAGALTGRLPWDQEVSVHLPGGRLNISVPQALDAVYLRGSAEEIFRGRVAL